MTKKWNDHILLKSLSLAYFPLLLAPYPLQTVDQQEFSFCFAWSGLDQGPLLRLQIHKAEENGRPIYPWIREMIGEVYVLI